MKRDALAALFLFANSAAAITVREYADALDRMRTLMVSKQIQQAHIDATALMGSEIVGGFRVTKTLAQKVTKIAPANGFAANLVTAVLVAAASFSTPGYSRGRHACRIPHH